MFLLISYLIISIFYYEYNINMGGVITGIIVAILWPIVFILWSFGCYFVYKEDQEMKKLLKLDKSLSI